MNATITAPASTSIPGHDADCLCPPCLMADMAAHLESQDIDPAGYVEIGETVSERTRYAKPGQRCGRGVVRKASPKQVRLIKRLMAERDTSKLVRLPGSEDIENMSLKGATDLIDRLFGCPELPRKTTVRMATQPMVDFVTKLLADRVYEGPEFDPATLTFQAARLMIDTLKAAPYKPREAKVAAVPGNAAVAGALTMGMYRHDDGRIVRTQKARGKTHLYAMVLDRAAGDAWIYTPGGLNGLTEAHRMTIDEVNELSLQLGACCCCGRQLTATVGGVGPAARTIGPICATKFGYMG